MTALFRPLPTITKNDLVFERRKYGRTTYTWVYLVIGGTHHVLGDPWPTVNIPPAELNAAIADKRAVLGLTV